MKRLLLILALVNTFSLFAIAPQYENQVIDKVTIEVNAPDSSPVNAEAIRSKLRMKESDFFSQNEFDSDLKMLAQDFNRVEPKLESIGGKMYITLKLWPKPTIRSINWCGNEKIKWEYLRDELGIKKGAVYDRQKFNTAFRQVRSYYMKQGFFEAQMDYTVEVDPVTNEADITVCIDEGRAGRIKKICFENFTKKEQNEILEQMHTRKYNFFLSWLTEEGTYNEDMIQQDQYMIINYLQNEGYADARVEVDVCEAKQNNRIIITIKADKGEVYRFGDITFEGNEIFDDEKVRSQFTIQEGCPYSPDALRKTVMKLQDMYGRCGYIDALIDFEPKLDPDCRYYDVHITISEGDQFRVGLIKVFGNCSTQTGTILHETLVVPGEVFNTDKLKHTEQRLQNIGFFKCVNVYAVRSEAPCLLGDNYRDVHIEVEETGTGNFSAFFGLSTLENAFGGLKITEKNFNWRGFCFNRLQKEGYSALRGGGEYAHVTATIGSKSRSYVLSWTKPYFMDTCWSVGFDIDKTNNRYVSNDYEINSGGLTIFAAKQINPFVRYSWHYRIRNTDIHLTGKSHSAKLCEEARNGGIISASGMSLSYDSTDSIERPTRGTKSRLEAEFAGIGGQSTFAGVAYLNTVYYQLNPEGVLKLRGDLKFLQPIGSTDYEDMPLDERLFLGGDDVLRGYRAYRVGPLFPGSSDDPRGGLSLQLYSAEYAHRLMSRLDAFVFFDAGSLTKEQWHFGRLYMSAGWGIKLKVFASGPPVTMGFGYPLNATDRNQIKRFFLTLGSTF